MSEAVRYVLMLLVWGEGAEMPNFFGDTKKQIREASAERRALNERMRPARATRLASGAVEDWTGVIKQAAAIVKVGKRPCDYEPWTRALEVLGRDPPFLGTRQPDRRLPYETLMGMAWDVARPGWEEARRDLIEFTLAFLEADVMLHGSGYAKRHLIKRLQQSELSDQDVARVQMLLLRAISEGTGLEEARAYRKIAAYLVVKGRLPMFEVWLEMAAKGAVITLDYVTGATWVEIMTSTQLSEADKERLSRVNWLSPSKWGLVFPEMSLVVRAGRLLKEPEQKMRRSAYLMLRTIKARQVSERR